MSVMRFLRPAGLVLGLALTVAQASAETTACTAITSVPYSITTSGVYCLTGDLMTSMTTDAAITVQANFVVIDLNGHRMGNGGAGTGTQAIGIQATDQIGITIKNGVIRSFDTAIRLTNPASTYQTGGHVIENMRIDSSRHTGISLMGAGSIIRDNVIADTGGSWAPGTGIAVYGANMQIIGNSVVNTAPQVTSTPGRAILVQAGISLVKGNTIANPTSQGVAVGIEIQNMNVVVDGNTIEAMNTGILFPQGYGGIYMNNAVMAAVTPFSGGTAKGSNNFSLP